ncbi:MAG: hypothetical protein QGH58_06710 [Arenicellales bacterium]|nr:hypothetical protein [Arenicellales bacterium]MDP6791585.1 hypothetical protein [Arenicellales bacterium]
MDFSGKRILGAGSSRGIGRATAKAFLDAGQLLRGLVGKSVYEMPRCLCTHAGFSCDGVHAGPDPRPDRPHHRV